MRPLVISYPPAQGMLFLPMITAWNEWIDYTQNIRDAYERTRKTVEDFDWFTGEIALAWTKFWWLGPGC